MDIRRSDLTEPEVVALLELHHEEMTQFSPPGTCHVLDLSGLQVPEVTVFAAWGEETSLLAIGAIKDHGDFAEIKSMRAHPDARGKGAGRAMLNHLLGIARSNGMKSVRLETGTGDLFEAANGLYQSAGFARCAAFAGYTPSEFNIFYELTL